MSGTSEGESSSKCLRYFSPLSARYKALLREAFVFERLCPPRLPGQGAEHLGPLLGRRRVLAGLKFVAQVREQLLKEALLLAGQKLRTQGVRPLLLALVRLAHTPVLDVLEPALLGDPARLRIRYALLQPQDSGPGPNRVLGDLRGLVRGEENVYHVYLFRDLLDRPVCALAEHLRGVGVHRDDAVALLLEVAPYLVAVLLGVIGEPHHRNGPSLHDDCLGISVSHVSSFEDAPKP